MALAMVVATTMAITTAGLDTHDKHTKNQFAKQPEVLRRIRDQFRKALVEENPDLPCLFLCDQFLTSYF